MMLNLCGELWGLSEALSAALKETALRNSYKVTVFSDSQSGIKKLQESISGTGQALRAQIVKKAKPLQTRGSKVIIQWVPSHSKVEGNKRADKVAKEAAIRGKVTTKWSFLVYINQYIAEAKKLEILSWYRAKNKERESRNCSYYVLRLKLGIQPTLGQAPKKYAAQFFQLRVGYATTGVFLERIGKRETAEYWWCWQTDQLVSHLYTKCRKWKKERRALKKEFKERGIGWQRRPESRWLASLLANEQTINPLLNFLMITDIEGKKGEREGAAEENRRAGEESEELLDSK